MPHSLSYLLLSGLVWLAALPLRRPRPRQALFLAASYLFYATWGLPFLGILFAASLLNYILGEYLRRRPSSRRLWLGLGLNLLLLVVFKYLPTGLAAAPGSLFGLLFGTEGALTWLRPVGISFWTFQAMSYLIDVYQGERLRPTLPEFLLYMAFWPTVLAGPIHRLHQLLPQFRQTPPIARNDLALGARRILIGLFMKLVLAQSLQAGLRPGEGLTEAFARLTAPGVSPAGLDAWLLAIGLGFQLFFDFAGYSHIVIGVARLFGLRLVENFDRPYLSTNPSAFWNRWHMSLSFWIRDYLFFPLAARRRSLAWRNLLLIFTMLVFGLWHGAAATFVLWGLYQGLLLVLHRQAQAAQRQARWQLPAGLGAALGWGLTFAAVCLGWLLFFAPSLSQAAVLLRAALSPSGFFAIDLNPNLYLLIAALAGGYFLVAGLLPWLWARLPQRPLWRLGWLLSPLLYAALIVLIILWSGKASGFIYFQF